jgi:hypothetical protein
MGSVVGSDSALGAPPRAAALVTMLGHHAFAQKTDMQENRIDHSDICGHNIIGSLCIHCYSPLGIKARDRKSSVHSGVSHFLNLSIPSLEASIPAPSAACWSRSSHLRTNLDRKGKCVVPGITVKWVCAG